MTTTPDLGFFSPFAPLWRSYFDFKVPFGMSPQPEEKRESVFFYYVYVMFSQGVGKDRENVHVTTRHGTGERRDMPPAE